MTEGDNSSGLPVPQPVIAPESRPHWEGVAAGILLLPRCRDCEVVIWYPRAICPVCGSTAIDWIRSTGCGSVYSCTVVRRPSPLYREAGPYVLAYVELDEGPRVMTNIVRCPPERVRIGDAVEACFESADGYSIVRFARSITKDEERE